MIVEQFQFWNSFTYQQCVIPLLNQGFVFITGKNGSGKSTPWEVLQHTVYGTTTKGLKKNGIVGKDLHKHRKPRIAERGGIVLLLSFSVFMALVHFLTQDTLALYVLGISLSFGLYGLWDDMKQSGKYSIVTFVNWYFIGELNTNSLSELTQ